MADVLKEHWICMGAARDKYDQIRIQSPCGSNILPSWRFAVMFIAAVLLGLHVEQVKSDDASPEARIQALERFIQEHPKIFDWRVHNELRHLYITATPPRLKESMKQADIILRYSVVDDYILKILSEWQLDKGREFAPFARGNLIMKVQAFPDLRFICAASLLTIGDLYAMEGNLKMAQSSYLRVANDTSYDMEQYRALAVDRIHLLKKQPREGVDVNGAFTAYGVLPDRSLSISLRAMRSGKSIAGLYTLSVLVLLFVIVAEIWSWVLRVRTFMYVKCIDDLYFRYELHPVIRPREVIARQ